MEDVCELKKDMERSHPGKQGESNIYVYNVYDI